MKLRQMDSAILVQLVLFEKLLKEFDNLVPRLRHSLPLNLIHHIPPRLQSAYSQETNSKSMIRIRKNTKLIPQSLLLQNFPPPIPLRIRKPRIPLRTNEQRRILDFLKVRGEVNVISRMGNCNCCKTIHSTQGQRMRSAPAVLPSIQSSV